MELQYGLRITSLKVSAMPKHAFTSCGLIVLLALSLSTSGSLSDDPSIFCHSQLVNFCRNQSFTKACKEWLDDNATQLPQQINPTLVFPKISFQLTLAPVPDHDYFGRLLSRPIQQNADLRHRR